MTDHDQPLLRVKLFSSRAVAPTYQSLLAAGMDLAACLPEGAAPVELVPVSRGGRPVLVPTGIAIAIPSGYEAQVRPRSGLAAKFGVSMPNSPGTIDADYRGEIMVPMINLGPDAFRVEHGMRIAQMVIAPVSRATIEVVAELDATTRGAGGFGSTGTR